MTSNLATPAAPLDNFLNGLHGQSYENPLWDLGVPHTLGNLNWCKLILRGKGSNVAISDYHTSRFQLVWKSSNPWGYNTYKCPINSNNGWNCASKYNPEVDVLFSNLSQDLCVWSQSIYFRGFSDSTLEIISSSKVPTTMRPQQCSDPLRGKLAHLWWELSGYNQEDVLLQ